MTRCYVHVLGVTLAAIAVSAAAPAPEAPADFTARAPLRLRGEGPWYRLELPMAVRLAAGHADLRDLRVFNADGEALPHSLRKATDDGPLVWSAPLAGQAGEGGEFTWTLGLPLPLERVRISVVQPDTLAPVALLGRADDDAPWTTLARGVLHRLVIDGRETVQEELELPGTPTRALRLQVDARGVGLGPAAPSLTVAVRATEVVFLARGRGPHALAVGRPGSAAASLPLATLVPGYDSALLPTMGVAELDGALQVAPAPAPAPTRGPAQFDWKQLGLWAVLLLAVLLLVAMAVSLVRSLPRRP